MDSFVEPTDLNESENTKQIELPGTRKYFLFPTIANNLFTSESETETAPQDLDGLNLGSPSRKKRFLESKLSISKSLKLKERKLLELKKSSPIFKAMKAKSLVRNFMQKFKKTKFYRDFSKLSSFHYGLINDFSTFYEETINNENSSKTIKKSWKQLRPCFFLLNFYNFLLKRLEPWIEKVPIINPVLWPKIIWDLMVSVLVYVQLFIFSLEITFFVNLEQQVFGMLFTIILYIDILISLNTIIFKNGIQITSRRLIATNFINRKFFSDILSAVFLTIIQLFFQHKQLNYLNLILILKVGKAKKSLYQIKQLIIKNEEALIAFKLFKLVVNIFFWGHLIACLWHFTGYMSNEINPQDNNWLKIKGIVDVNWKTKYLYSIYWSVTTMLSVGYGDITASNSVKTIFNIFAMFLGCCVFGYSVTIITSIFKQANRKTAILEDRMSKVSFMLRDKKLPLETQTKIKKYLGFVWKQEQNEDPEYEALIMNKLSSNLRDEIYLYTNVKYLESVPAFKSFTNQTLICLARAMKKVRVCPEELVYKEGDFDNLGIYFVIEGDLDLITERESVRSKKITRWRSYKKGDFFGGNESFTGSPRNFSVVSCKFSTLFFLERSEIIHILKKNQKDYEKFCLIRDMEYVYNDEKLQGIKCDSCGFFDHKINACPFLRYNPNKMRVIERHLKKRRVKAKKFKRRALTTESALVDKDNYTKMAAEFLNVYADDEDLEYLQDVYTPSVNQFDSSILEEKAEENYPREAKGNIVAQNQEYKVIVTQDDTPLDFYKELRPPTHYSRKTMKKKSVLKRNQYCERISSKNRTFSRANPGPNQTKTTLCLTTCNRSSYDLKKDNDVQNDLDNSFSPELELLRESYGNLDTLETKAQDGPNLNLPTTDVLQKIPAVKFDFDRVKSFENYFPAKNIENFMIKYNKNTI